MHDNEILERIRNLVGCVPRNGISIRGGDFLAAPDRSILSVINWDRVENFDDRNVNVVVMG